MRRFLSLGLTLALLSPAACSDDPERGSGEVEVHPRVENLLVERTPHATITLPDETRDPSWSLPSDFTQILPDYPAALRIGELRGDPETANVFGSVHDAELFADGDFIVLDAAGPRLHLFDRHGQRLATAGRGGEGPGEFREPRALSLRNDSSVLVIDGTGRVSEFLRTGDSLAYDRQFRIDASPVDMCARNDTVYVLSPDPAGEVVQVYSVDGDSLFAFGKIYESDNPLVTMSIQQGTIGCSQEAVVLGFTVLPYVFVFSPEGRLKEFIELDGFVPMSLVERPSGGVGSEYRDGDSIQHFILRVATAEANGAFVQVARRSVEGSRRGFEYDHLVTYRLEWYPLDWQLLGISHVEVFRGRSGRSRTSLVGGTDAPFPQVLVSRRQEGDSSP